MLLAHKPRIPVLFLETGYHFPETIEYRDRLTSEWKLNLFNLEAKQSVADQESQFGILNQTDPIALLQAAQSRAVVRRPGAI